MTETSINKIIQLLCQDTISAADFRRIRDSLDLLEYQQATRVRLPVAIFNPKKPPEFHCSVADCVGPHTIGYKMDEDKWLCEKHAPDMAIGNPKLAAACYRIGRTQ